MLGFYWQWAKMAKYGDQEARPDEGQNEFSDIIKSRSGRSWKPKKTKDFYV